MLRLVLALGMLLAGLSAAGCMGDETSRADFETQVVESRDRTDAALEHVTGARTWDDLIERIVLAGDAAEAASDDLAETGAPGELEDEARELRLALRALAEEILATAEALDDEAFEGSTVQGLEFENWNRVQRALAALRKQGVEVPPLERHG
jgi:hypothetical protein